MATSTAKDIADFLDSEGTATLGTNLFVGRLPESNSTVAAVYDAGGPAPNPKYKFDEPEVLFNIRGARNDYNGGYTLTKDIRDKLLGCGTQTINSKTYSSFLIISDVAFITYDENERPIFSLNFRFIVENTPGGNRDNL